MNKKLTTPAERLKFFRENKGMTQAIFGEKIGLKWYQVKDIETGKVKIKPSLAKALYHEYGCSEEWLLTGKEHTKLSLVTDPHEIYERQPDLKAIMKALMELHAKDEKEYRKVVGIINRLLDLYYDDIGGEERKRQTKGLRKTG